MTLRICTFMFLVSFGFSTHASIVTWVVGTDGSWDVPGNWVGGVIPTATDSVVIAGTGSLARVSSAATAIHVTVTDPAKFGIILGGNLLIEDSTEEGIYLTGEMRILTGGSLTIDNAGDEGILTYHSITNNGTIVIRNCVEGIEFPSAGDTLFNHGSIEILNTSSTALKMSNSSHLDNTSAISITDCANGILLITSVTVNLSSTSQITIENTTSEAFSVRHNVVVLNEGNITIDDFGTFGIRCYGSITNVGLIDITQEDIADIGVRIDSFGSPSGSVYLGMITNTSAGIIQIDHAETGLLCQPSSTLLNEGAIEIMDCSGIGFYMEPRSGATLVDGSVMMLSEMFDPLIIDEEATLDVEVGAELTADL